MMTVVLLQRFAQAGGPAYNVGERIALADPLATSLLASGIARLAVVPPAVNRMITAAPVSKRPATPAVLTPLPSTRKGRR